MQTELCDGFGIDVPFFGFTDCRDGVVEVSRAGASVSLAPRASRPNNSKRSCRGSMSGSGQNRTECRMLRDAWAEAWELSDARDPWGPCPG